MLMRFDNSISNVDSRIECALSKYADDTRLRLIVKREGGTTLNQKRGHLSLMIERSVSL